jgi:hypothetical protein
MSSPTEVDMETTPQVDKTSDQENQELAARQDEEFMRDSGVSLYILDYNLTMIPRPTDEP